VIVRSRYDCQDYQVLTLKNDNLDNIMLPIHSSELSSHICLMLSGQAVLLSKQLLPSSEITKGSGHEQTTRNSASLEQS
jgi:hypothetical protein